MFQASLQGDRIESKKNKSGRKIYRCRARVAIPAALLVEAITDTDRVTEWNKTLTEARVLRKLSEDCAISYQVEQPAAAASVFL